MKESKEGDLPNKEEFIRTDIIGGLITKNGCFLVTTDFGRNINLEAVENREIITGLVGPESALDLTEFEKVEIYQLPDVDPVSLKVVEGDVGKPSILRFEWNAVNLQTGENKPIPFSEKTLADLLLETPDDAIDTADIFSMYSSKSGVQYAIVELISAGDSNNVWSQKSAKPDTARVLFVHPVAEVVEDKIHSYSSKVSLSALFNDVARDLIRASRVDIKISDQYVLLNEQLEKGRINVVGTKGSILTTRDTNLLKNLYLAQVAVATLVKERDETYQRQLIELLPKHSRLDKLARKFRMNKPHIYFGPKKFQRLKRGFPGEIALDTSGGTNSLDRHSVIASIIVGDKAEPSPMAREGGIEFKVSGGLIVDLQPNDIESLEQDEILELMAYQLRGLATLKAEKSYKDINKEDTKLYSMGSRILYVMADRWLQKDTKGLIKNVIIHDYLSLAKNRELTQLLRLKDLPGDKVLDFVNTSLRIRRYGRDPWARKAFNYLNNVQAILEKKVAYKHRSVRNLLRLDVFTHWSPYHKKSVYKYTNKNVKKKAFSLATNIVNMYEEANGKKMSNQEKNDTGGLSLSRMLILRTLAAQYLALLHQTSTSQGSQHKYRLFVSKIRSTYINLP